MPDLEIGGVRVASPIWLAPLAGVTTYTFRAYHREMGAGLVHTEMVSAVGLSYRNKKTRDLLGDPAEPGPVVLQLFAPDASSLARGAEIALSEKKFAALEINMACPMPKVAKKGSGASLLERPAEAKQMVAALKAFSLPVWVKLRITSPKCHPLTTEAYCAEMLEAGADLLMLHGRTPAQRYEGIADRSAICRAAAAFPGLLVASGDYYAPEDAVHYLAGGCVAVLAARGSLRDVYLIPKTLAALGYKVPEKYLAPTLADQIDALIELGRRGALCEGPVFTLVLVRRMSSGLFKGMPGASAIRQKIAACRDWPTLESALTDLRSSSFALHDVK